MSPRPDKTTETNTVSRFRLTVGRRAMVALALGCFAAAVAYSGRQTGVQRSDWDETWVAGRALLDGLNPYAALQIAYQAGEFHYPLVYPAPAVLLTAPFGLLPLDAARWFWVGIGTAALAWALLGRGWWGLLGLGSTFYLHALLTVQWSPILTAAVAVPALGFVWAAKPTIGAALFVGWPTRGAVIGVLAIIALSFALMPGWVSPFLAGSLALPNAVAPVFRPGGFLLLLSFLRWRRPEARMLGTLALVPHATLLYEMVPLLLIPHSWREMLALCSLSLAAGGFALQTDPSRHLTAAIDTLWPVFLLLIYLPSLGLVLRRANRGDESSRLCR